MADTVGAVRVLVVVASQTGRTRRMADAFADGAREAGAEALVRGADEAGESEVLEADVLAVGSGVHMAGVEASLRAFFERLSAAWMRGDLVGKLGAAFVSGGAGGRGGAELALINIWAHFAEQGVLTVPMHNRVKGFAAAGCHWGPLAWTTPRDGEAGPTAKHLDAVRAHAAWVVECARRWRQP
jgi:NAD(P)H dehydrogenase (quinone)